MKEVKLQLNLKKLTGLIYITDELLNDTDALQKLVMERLLEKAPGAFEKIDE